MVTFSMMARTALCAVLLFCISACSYTVRRPLREISEAQAQYDSAGTSVAVAHGTTVQHFLGFVFVGSASFIPGKSQSQEASQELFETTIGPSKQIHFQVSLHGAADRCSFSPEVVSLLNQTLDDLYQTNPGAAFPSSISLDFVLDGSAVNRQDYAWRFGGTAHLRYWFSCYSGSADKSLLFAYLTTVHELTHAVVGYRGGEPEDKRDVARAERTADGASACFYLLMKPPLGDQLRKWADESSVFLNPVDPARNNPDKESFCAVWRARMRFSSH